MNKKKGLASIMMICLFANSAMAAISEEWWGSVRPYVGFDAQFRRMNYHAGYGDNLLFRQSPQANIYVGLKFNDYVGAEIGYDATSTLTRDATLTTGQLAAGSPIEEDTSPAVFKSKSQLRGAHADLVGFYSFCENWPTQLFGSVGIGFVRGMFERRSISMNNMPSSTNRTFGKHRAALRLTGGLQYLWNCHLGMRVSIGYVNTNNLRAFQNDGVPSIPVAIIKPKDSFVYGLGLFWLF